MKKLMVIATVAFAAFASNAATIKWSVGDVNDINGEFMMDSGYTVSIICTAVPEGFSGFSTGTVVSGAGLAWGMGAGDIFSDEVSTGTFKFTATAYAPNGTTLDMGPYTVNAEAGKSTYTATWNPHNTAEDWKGGAVPEPTSGMLLILGVAGLALRRRRA